MSYFDHTAAEMTAADDVSEPLGLGRSAVRSAPLSCGHTRDVHREAIDRLAKAMLAGGDL